VSTPLSAPLEIGFDYTRSLGPALSRFMTGLRERRIVGSRGPDGRVHVPPAEFDPVSCVPHTEFVEVAEVGTVLSWSWQPRPRAGQPLDRPFAWALVRLDGADTALLHAVDAAYDRMRTGMRVRVRWAPSPTGDIHDILCFEPDDPVRITDTQAKAAHDHMDIPDLQPMVEMVVTPIRLTYEHSASPEESRYLRALAEGRIVGQRCPACRQVYVPPRSACPTDGVPTTEEVELPDVGTVTTFCIVNVPFAGQRVKPPYVAAYVLLDGADIPIQHLILGCDAADVRIGMRVRAVWKPSEEWGTTPENISHFAPEGTRS